MQVYIRIFLAFIHIYRNICMIPVINQLWPAGPADTRMHDRPARPTAFCWNQKYPRICGEKWYTGCVSRRRVRITPAYAGKRLFLHSSDYDCWDHPRMCGEKAAAESAKRAEQGSPPHMRGKVIAISHRSTILRITPAYAGVIPYRQACPAPAAAPRCPPPGWRPPLFRP